MAEFLQSYGILIIFGLLFLFMLRGRGHGMGCGMGHQHNEENQPEEGLSKDAEPNSTNRGSGCH